MPYTIDQLEAFVSSPAYDADIARAIAARVPELAAYKAEGTRSAPPAATTTATPAQSGREGKGQPGEKIAPGITRIRGNLCNVHGKWGPCDKALSGKKPPKGRARTPKKPPKPKKTDDQKRAEREQARAADQAKNTQSVAQRMVDSDTGLSPSGMKALEAFAGGTPPTGAIADGLVQMGMAERDSAGNLRMSDAGRETMNAAKRGDYQGALDAMSRGADQVANRGAADTKRAAAAQARAERLAKRKPAKAGSPGQRAVDAIGAQLSNAPTPKQGGAKKPTPKKETAAPVKRLARQRQRALPKGGAPAGGGKVDKPKAPKPAAEPKLVTTPELADTARRLSNGEELSAEDTQTLIRNGLARQLKDGTLLLSETGLRATRQTTKAFQVFKDARGNYRWVAFSSTAYRDRDGEIVSTKALGDDCAFADAMGAYGPLRWWHVPGLDLGDCDFNAMHGRVLIESGTFRSPAIAQKVAAYAPGLEISLGFLHPPDEPDAAGVFHSIRRFERSLTPRGKASNLFTSFHVKEQPNMDETKKAALKALGFSDSDILDLEGRAVQTQKSADDQGVAYKADEPAEPQEITLNGQTYVLKAAPPIEGTPEEEAAETPEEEAIEPPDEMDDPTALTLSAGDIDAIASSIGAAVTQAIQPLLGLLDIEKKMQGHVQGMLAPFQQAEAKKDTEQAELREQLKATQDKLAEIVGDAPAVGYRATQAKDNLLTDATLLAVVKAQNPGAGPWDDVISGLGLQTH